MERIRQRKIIIVQEKSKPRYGTIINLRCRQQLLVMKRNSQIGVLLWLHVVETTVAVAS